MSAHATPPSVGYAVTEMIRTGILDDCLHLIERASRARRAILARDASNRPLPGKEKR